MKIMGFTDKGPIAGTVVNISTPQYPGESTMYKVMCVEGYEGWLAEGKFTEFNQNGWNRILEEWNKILEARAIIQNILWPALIDPI